MLNPAPTNIAARSAPSSRPSLAIRRSRRGIAARLRRVELGDEIVERAGADRRAQAAHQIAIIPQIVPAQQHARQDLAAAAEMVEIGAAVGNASRTGAF